MIAADRASLRSLVAEYLKHDTFCFDVETYYTPTPDEAEELKRITDMRPAHRTVDDKKWSEAMGDRPLDHTRNEIFWIGLSTDGRADAIACGHPHGRLLKPARREKISVQEAYGADDPRCTTKGGRVSNKMVWRSLPDVFAPPPSQLSMGEVVEIIRPLFFNPEIRKINHNIKFDILSLSKYFGEMIPGPWEDTMVMQHLLDERLMSYKLGDLIKRHFSHGYDKLGSKGVGNFAYLTAAKYAMQDARFTWLLRRKLLARLEKFPALRDLYYGVEMPAYEAFTWMESVGVPVDVNAMNVKRKAMERSIAETLDKLIVDFGVPTTFNPNAPSQIIDLLYNQLGAPVTKMTEKTKTPSTDADTLEEISKADIPASPASKLLLEFAESHKILGTYLVGPKFLRDDEGRVHPSYWFHSAVTGRTSCSSPNIQNIPRESDMREMFHAPKGWVMVTGDYDQIELRLIAEYSGDDGLIEMFNSDVDIHLATSARVQGVDPSHPDAKKNRTTHGKTPNFLVGYGGTYKLLAEKTGISEEEAKRIFDMWFAAFRRVNPWKNRIISGAIKKAKWNDSGRLIVPPYVETALGRRRRLEDLVLNPNDATDWKEKSKIRSRIASAERMAVNAVVQGTAAEIAKLATIRLQEFKRANNYPIEFAIFVHDELVSFVPKSCAEEIVPIYREIMTGVTMPNTGKPPMERVKLLSSIAVSERWQKG